MSTVSAKQIVSELGYEGMGGTVDAELLYKNSFGDIANETVYYDPWRLANPLDSKSGPKSIIKGLGQYHIALQKSMQKAFTFAGSAATLLPVYVDPEITRAVNEVTRFLPLVRRVSNLGRSANYNKITALSSADWKAEDADLPESEDTYVRAQEMIKFGYAVGRVTGPAMAAMDAYADAKALEVTNKTVSLRLQEEETVIRGEALASASDADIYVADAQGFDGLIKIITTNDVDASSAKLSSDMLRSAVRLSREAGGNPNLILVQSKDVQNWKGGLTDYVVYNTQQIGTLEYGFQNIVHEGIPILEMPINMPTTVNKRVALVLDMRMVELRVLQDVMMQDLAQTNDSSKFMVKIYETLINKAEQFCSKITDLGDT